jgi:outer membrane receptor protein involved in Fe transport
MLNGGLAYDRYEQKFNFFPKPIARNKLSPKVGIVWSPVDGTTLRAAAFSSVRRPFIANQTIEPTQVAGFNQFFTGLEPFYGDPEGTVSRRVALAIDQTVSQSVFVGLEGAVRRLEVPSIVLEADRTWRENSGRAYLYKTISSRQSGRLFSGWEAAISLNAEYENLRRPNDFTGSEGIVDVKTERIPLGISLFAPSGLVVRASTSYVHQKGKFSRDTFEPEFPTNDQAWIVDLVLEWRLPRRLGTVSIGSRNLSDSSIDIVDTEPLNPRVARGRLTFGAFTFIF